MRHSLPTLIAGGLLVLLAGCDTTPLVLDVPGSIPGEKIVEANPVYIPLGPQPEAYAKVFENCLRVLCDYGFDILESNRYDGRIETVPRIAPGLLLFLKPGSPLIQERTLATLQTYRHRVSIRIDTAENGGYFIEVIVRKELLDLPRPVKQTAGNAVFRNFNDVERQFEVVDPTFYEKGWIFKGRDPAMEDKLIQALKKLM
jgi:hypothetical protein